MDQFNRQFFRQEFYTNKIVLIDGISRTGKSMLGPLLSSFNDVEVERIEPILEMLPLLHYFGQIDKQTAIAVLRQEIDMRLYDTMLGRNTNFRLKDHTSAFRSSKGKEYLKRLVAKEGDNVIDRIKEKEIIFQNQTHDLLGHCHLYFEAFGERLRIFEMVRHPIDVAYSFNSRNWGERYGADPRNFTLTINHEGTVLPWYAIDWEDEYLKMRPMDRIIKFIEVITNWNKKGFDSLSEDRQKQVLFIPFEKFVSKPESFFSKMENFIDKKRTSSFDKALKRERCPRVLNEMEREKKMKKIKELATEEAYEKLLVLSKEYENQFLEIKVEGDR